MLSLQLRTGDYMTIGADVVVQLNDISCDRCRLMIDAPREVPILRGDLLERGGGERPECVLEMSRRHKQSLAWNRNKSQALNSMRRVLRQMDRGSEDVRTLLRQLDFIFPPEFASNETIRSPE